MTLVSSAIAVFPIVSASREELVGAVGFIAVAPSPIEAMEELERGKAKPSDYWAEQSSQEGQGRLFSAVDFRF